MSDFSDAYAEVSRVVQPDADPTLTHGDGAAPDEAMELDRIILSSSRGTVWSAGVAVSYGAVILPATRMGRRFKVTRGGTLGSTEPSWPDYDYAPVTSGTVEMVEDGADYSNVYDVRKAIRDAWTLKAAKASEYTGEDERHIYQHCVEQARRYAPVGVA